MDALRLLDTPLILIPGQSSEETDQECALAFERSKKSQQLVDGLISWEEYLEFMFEQGIEPEDLLATAEANLEFCQREGIQIER